MDARTFDRVIAEAAQPSRRRALRLLAAGLLGGVLAGRWAAPTAAQRSDRDGDGLYDDDELGLYGTDPDAYDTDFDGVGDGEEVYYGSNPLVGDLVVQQAPPPAANGDPVAIGDVNSGGNADSAIGVGDTWGVTCREVGGACDTNDQCCNIGAVLCCFDGTYLSTRCTDVTAYGGICL
jgi:hypothetical protein